MFVAAMAIQSAARATEDPMLTPRNFAGFHQNHWSILQLCPSLQPSQLSGSGVHRDVRQLLFLLEGPHAIADLCSNLGPPAKVCQVESIRNQQVCFLWGRTWPNLHFWDQNSRLLFFSRCQS